MIGSNISILFRFLVGIVLIQGAAAVLAYAALSSEHIQVWLLLGALALIMGVVAAFWFASMAAHSRKDALVRVQESFSREREQIRVKAEREKTRVVRQSHQQIAKERNRAQHKANFKVGASLAAVLALGMMMLLTQFVTIGLLTLTTAGGAVGGYLFRARHDRHTGKEETPGLPSAGSTRLGARAPWHGRLGLLRKIGAPSPGSPETPA